jgi:hypothetical protein
MIDFDVFMSAVSATANAFTASASFEMLPSATADCVAE